MLTHYEGKVSGGSGRGVCRVEALKVRRLHSELPLPLPWLAAEDSRAAHCRLALWAWGLSRAESVASMP